MRPHKLSHWISNSSVAPPTNALHRLAAGGAVVALHLLVVSALVNRFIAKRAERNNPPIGKFVDVGALRLHYIEQGDGEPLVLLHGNSGMIQDFTSSGLVEGRPKDTGSSSLTGPVLVTAIAHVARSGHLKLEADVLHGKQRSNGLAFRVPPSLAIPGEPRWRLRWR